jgi:hypothetical protein
MNIDEKHEDIKPCSSKKKSSSKIANLLDEIKDKGIFAIAQMNEEDQVTITKWALDIYDRYESVLENQPTKIKNIVELPASKQEVKMAIKILLTTYVLKQSDEMVDRLKDRYISIGAFQNIDLEDREKIFYEVDNMEQELESDYVSVFPEYHKHMEVAILEQNILLEDVNNFINDLKELKNEV